MCVCVCVRARARARACVRERCACWCVLYIGYLKMIFKTYQWFVTTIDFIFFFLCLSLICRQKLHVRYCGSCRKAQRRFESIGALLWASAFVLLLLTPLAPIIAKSLHRPASVKLQALLACVAMVLCGLAKWLSMFIERAFFFEDFVHAVND